MNHKKNSISLLIPRIYQARMFMSPNTLKNSNVRTQNPFVEHLCGGLPVNLFSEQFGRILLQSPFLEAFVNALPNFAASSHNKLQLRQQIVYVSEIMHTS